MRNSTTRLLVCERWGDEGRGHCVSSTRLCTLHGWMGSGDEEEEEEEEAEVGEEAR